MIPQALQQAEFKAAIEVLVNEVAPAAIVCFGCNTRVQRQITCFHEYTTTHHHYDIVIITTNNRSAHSTPVTDIAQQLTTPTLSLHVLVHREAAVEHALKIGQPFFCKIVSQGTWVYTSNTWQVKQQTFQLHTLTSEALAQQNVQRPFALAERLLATASVAIHQTAAYDVGVFLLHQVVEQLCIASARAQVHYRLTTHSLTRLIDMVACYLPQVREIFPGNTPHEQQLFDVLRKAYSDVRYKELYTVPPHTARELLTRVHTFKTLLENNHTRLPNEIASLRHTQTC